MDFNVKSSNFRDFLLTYYGRFKICRTFPSIKGVLGNSLYLSILQDFFLCFFAISIFFLNFAAETL